MLTYLGTGDFWMTLVSGLLFHENNYMMSPSYDAMGIMIFKPPTTKQDKVHVSTVGRNGLQNLPIICQKLVKRFVNFIFERNLNPGIFHLELGVLVKGKKIIFRDEISNKFTTILQTSCCKHVIPNIHTMEDHCSFSLLV